MGAGFCRETPMFTDTLHKPETVVFKQENFLPSPWTVTGITHPIGKETELSADNLWRQCQGSGPSKPWVFLSFLLMCLVFSSFGKCL